MILHSCLSFCCGHHGSDNYYQPGALEHSITVNHLIGDFLYYIPVLIYFAVFDSEDVNDCRAASVAGSSGGSHGGGDRGFGRDFPGGYRDAAAYVDSTNARERAPAG